MEERIQKQQREVSPTLPHLSVHFLAVPETEPRASHMLAKYAASEVDHDS